MPQRRWVQTADNYFLICRDKLIYIYRYINFFILFSWFICCQDSEHSSDDLSSGVFSSCNSQTGGHLQWLVENQLPSHCFDGMMAGVFFCCILRWFIKKYFSSGVDIWIENVQGECLRIREHRQVKVGHVAIGISEQVRGCGL